MKKLFLRTLAMTLFALSSNAQTKKDGTPDMRYSSNKGSSYTPSSTSTEKGASRPVYSGNEHTTSHGGTYVGEQNTRTHKGGTYTNPKSNNDYGIHKKK
jgi:hypothetical protein